MLREIKLYFNQDTSSTLLEVPYSIKVLVNQNSKSKLMSVQRFVGNKSKYDKVDASSFVKTLYNKYLKDPVISKIEYYVDSEKFVEIPINQHTIMTHRMHDTVQYNDDSEMVVIEEAEIYFEGV